LRLEEYQTIKFDRRGRVLTMTLNRPEALNAVSGRLHTELSHLFYDVQLDEDSDILVLTGAGRAFSAGGDFQQMIKANKAESIHGDLLEAKKMIYGLLDLEKPIISKINGDAMGLGATLALFCDVIFAADTARIADPHVSVGIAAGDGGAIIWPQFIGYARAKHYLMTWTKVATNIGLKQLAHSIMDVGLGYENVTIKSQDHAEGIAAFLEKRKPRFGQGR